VFGVLVVAFATALGGGIIRDLLMGDTPPASLRSRRFVVVALVGGAIVFVIHGAVSHLDPDVLMVLDAIGLSLFAVSGAELAVAGSLPALTAILLGAVTGVGGGTIRDILLNEVPAVLRTDVYAVAAVLGATVFVVSVRLGVSRRAALALGASACFVLRVVSATQHWNLPVA
jgi:uncharacterized membrane protein YeiH